MSLPERRSFAVADVPCVEKALDGLRDRGEPAFWTADGHTTWKEWAADVSDRRDAYLAISRSAVGLIFRPAPASYAALCALSAVGCHVYLIDPDLPPEEVRGLRRVHGIGALIDPEGGPGQEAPDFEPGDGEFTGDARGEVTIFTSGSTGVPKAVRHDWATLCRPVRLGPPTARQTWLLTYRPHLYAGVQVFLHCLLNRGALVISAPFTPASELIELMGRSGVRQVSATPSYWRLLLTLGDSEELRALEIAQITLGGEASDQPLLDRLKRLFPAARIAHIYATSELGRCFSVNDGLAGFPTRYLDAPTEDGVALKVLDGELHVRSANAMLGDGPDWRPTGDLVEISGDRCHFGGRRTEIINVGGNKVHPLLVERVVLTVPGVVNARAFGRRSSVVGQMVACEIVVGPGHAPEAVKQAVSRECLERLAAHERPRFLQVVDAIDLSGAGKKVRRDG